MPMQSRAFQRFGDPSAPMPAPRVPDWVFQPRPAASPAPGPPRGGSAAPNGGAMTRPNANARPNRHPAPRQPPPARPGARPPRGAPGAGAPGASAPGIPGPAAGPGGPPPPPPPPTSPPPPGAPPGAPPAGAPPPGLPAPPMSQGMTDIYDVYKSAIPIMAQERDDQISQAMAAAGLSGNRFSSSAQKTAGDIGAQTALRQNQLLTNLMFEQGNRDLDRALSATNTSLQATSLQDQLERNRLDALFRFGGWEQGRQDEFSRMAYEDWDRNKYGLLPLLIQFANGQSGGSGPTPYTVTQPGSQGAADWLTLLAGLF